MKQKYNIIQIEREQKDIPNRKIIHTCFPFCFCFIFCFCSPFCFCSLSVATENVYFGRTMHVSARFLLNQFMAPFCSQELCFSLFGRKELQSRSHTDYFTSMRHLKPFTFSRHQILNAFNKLQFLPTYLQSFHLNI